MKPPRFEAVNTIGPTRLRIAWTTGERLEVDLAEPIDRLKVLHPCAIRLSLIVSRSTNPGSVLYVGKY
jgi:hypothetical protein